MQAVVASPGPGRRPGSRPHCSLLLLSLLGPAFGGCVSARINVVDERTALENQILGRYQELDESLLQLASVRAGQDEGWTPEQATVRDNAIRARRIQRFVQDDVDELLRLGCLGEGRTARLIARPCAEAENDRKLDERVQRVARLENEARQAILIFVIETTPEFSRKDLPRLESAWARLRAEQAPAGTWLEDADGAWAKK